MSAIIPPLFVTHKDEDLHPSEKIYNHRCWTGAKLQTDYMFLVKGFDSKGVCQKFIFSHPFRAVEKVKELSHRSIARIALVYWPDDEDSWTTEHVQYIRGTPSLTDFKVKTTERMCTYKNKRTKEPRRPEPFWLLYSDEEDADLNEV